MKTKKVWRYFYDSLTIDYEIKCHKNISINVHTHIPALYNCASNLTLHYIHAFIRHIYVRLVVGLKISVNLSQFLSLRTNKGKM